MYQPLHKIASRKVKKLQHISFPYSGPRQVGQLGFNLGMVLVQAGWLEWDCVSIQ